MFDNNDQVANRDNACELRMYQAVIVHTIEEWMSGPLRKSREAEQYLFQDNVDFPEVCQRAGMDAGRLRSKLSKLRKQVVPVVQVLDVEEFDENSEIAA